MNKQLFKTQDFWLSAYLLASGAIAQIFAEED